MPPLAAVDDTGIGKPVDGRSTRPSSSAVRATSAFPESTRILVVTVRLNESLPLIVSDVGAGITRGVVAKCRVTARGLGPVDGVARQPAASAAHVSESAIERGRAKCGVFIVFASRRHRPVYDRSSLSLGAAIQY